MSRPLVPLVVPRTGPSLLFAPYHYLALTRDLAKAGYDPVIIDARLTNARIGLRRLLDSGRVAGVGMTAMMGPQLSFGLQLSEFVKEGWPHVPVIWGGILPTELPELTLAHPAIDAVVLNSGERRFPALLDALRSGEVPSGLDGLGYIDHGEARVQPSTPATREHPSLQYDWDRVDMSPYLMNQFGIGKRTLSLITSRGCPQDCTFCYGPQFHGTSWTGQSAEEVLGDIDYLQSRYGFDGIFFNDDNFAVSARRVREVAVGCARRGLKFGLGLHVSGLDEDLVRDLADCGCVRLSWGAESGSQRMLDVYGKGTRPEQTLELASWCRRYDLAVRTGFMVGHPEETDRDLAATLDHIDELMTLHPALEIENIRIFAPYPGTAFFDRAVAAGFESPTRIEDWSTFYWKRSGVPWLTEERRRNLELISYTSLTAFATWRARSLSPLQGRMVDVLNKVERRRWDKRFFKLAPELRLLQRWVDEHRADRTGALDRLRLLREVAEDRLVAWWERGRAVA